MTGVDWPFRELLTPEQQRLLRSRVLEREFPSDALVLDEQTDGPGALLVASGRLRLYMLGSEGHEVTLFYVEKGECLLLGPEPVSFSVPLGLALDAECESQVLVLSGDTVGYLLSRNGELALWAYRWVSETGSRMLRSLQRVLYAGIEQRVAQSLMEQCAWRKSQILQITQEKLAHQASSSREVVTRTLKAFSVRGLIATRRGRIEVLDGPGLRAIADGAGKRGETP